MMLSVTMLSSYIYCPRKLYLERVLKFSKFPKAAMIKGTIRHHAYDAIINEEESLIKSIQNNETQNSIFKKYKYKYFALLK